MTRDSAINAENDARQALVVATQILIQQGLMDAFGHVSLRHPTCPDQYLSASAVAPSEVSMENLVVLDLNSQPVVPVSMPLYKEKFIHGSIYKSRSDISAICHFHPQELMPFCITDQTLIPVSQTGACMGAVVPAWDSQDEFGDTNLLVSNQEQGDSVARTLGNEWVVLMRHHGACIVGRDIRELVFRAVYTCRDAATILKAAALGEVKPLSVGELGYTAQPKEVATDRCWRHLMMQLTKQNSLPSPQLGPMEKQ